MGKIMMAGVVTLMGICLAACQPSQYYVPQTQDEAWSAMDKATDENRAPVDRIAWADAALRSGLLSQRNQAITWFNRGLANYDLSQYETSAGDQDRAIALDSDFGEAYGARGNALYMLGYYQDAIDDYNQAHRLTRNAIYRQYARDTQQDMDDDLPPPYLEELERWEEANQPASYSLVLTGVQALQLQRDAIADPGNEAYFHLDFENNGQTWRRQVPSGGYYKFVRNREWANIQTSYELPAGVTTLTIRGYEDDRDEDLGMGGTDSLGQAARLTIDAEAMAGTDPARIEGREYHYLVHLMDGRGSDYVLMFRVQRR